MLKEEWEKGIPFLGHRSYPVPWCYVGADRSLRSIHRTFLDIGLDPYGINIIPCWGKDRKTIPQVSDLVKDFKLIVIEGFAGFSEGENSASVRNYLTMMQRWCDEDGVSIIGVAESPKMKPHERYENPRQRVSGCAAWAHYTETVMLVEPKDCRHPSLPERMLYICPRNGGPGYEIEGNFSDTGRLIFMSSGIKTKEQLLGEPQVSPFKRVN